MFVLLVDWMSCPCGFSLFHLPGGKLIEFGFNERDVYFGTACFIQGTGNPWLIMKDSVMK